MNKTTTILLSLGIVITNNAIGHFFAPNGILFTPIVLILLSILIGFVNTDLKPIGKSALLTGLIILHDIGLKLYAGGRHDHEGLGIMHLLLFIGLIPAFGILIGGIFKAKKESKRNKWLAIILFPVIITIHLLIFSNLGLGRYYWYEWN